MQVTHLSLTNFRNYVRLEADLPRGALLLVGSNAQGKTSLLEAIQFLSTATSPQAASDQQVINFLALKETPAFARISAELVSSARLQRIEIRLILDPNPTTRELRTRKEILINGIKRRRSDLSGVINTVLFRPQDMLTIEGSPSLRRRYLDQVVSQAEPSYAAALGEYGKVLAHRNALLRRFQERSGDPSQLAFWDEKLAALAASLTRARAIALGELESLAAKTHLGLSRGAETLRLEYQPSFSDYLDPVQPPSLMQSNEWTSISHETIRQSFLKGFQQRRREEFARGTTVIGPHRDDFLFLSNGLDLRSYGSRGQNRTAMLALKLAEVDWLHQRSGEWPVVLLDEVLAELDGNRRRDLLAHIIEAQQAILTTSELTMFDDSFKQQTTLWQVSGGKIAPLKTTSGRAEDEPASGAQS